MSLFQKFFRCRGLLARGAFWARVLVLLLVFMVTDSVLRPLLGTSVVYLLNPLALWALVAAGGQRLHDRGYSAVWLWFGLVPVVGAAWLVWQFVRKGAGSAAHTYLRDAQDFLVVR